MRGRSPAVLAPLSPERQWRAIVLATLVLVPAFWGFLAGFVALADDDGTGGPAPAAAIAFGLALLPFVFVAAAFLSEHPRAPQATLRAMGLCLLVGIPVSAVAADAVTGLVAGVGAGGIAALRRDTSRSWRPRAIAVGAAALYAFVLVRAAGQIALLSAPVFPFTAIGVADHWVQRRAERDAATSPSASSPASSASA